MKNQDWSAWGERIKDTVQSAIDSQDFSQLNVSLKQTVNQALDWVEQAIDGVSDPETEKVKRQKSYGKSAEERLPLSKLQAQRYENVSGQSVLGTVLFIIGLITGCGCGITSFIMIFFMLALAAASAGGGGIFAFLWMFFLTLALAGAAAGKKGYLLMMRAKRFGQCVKLLKRREVCSLKELEQHFRLPHKKQVKELQYMIEKGWFKQGHLDEQETSLIVTHEAYEQYLSLQAVFEKQEQERIQRKEKQRQKENSIPEEVKNIILEGRGYLEEIRACNEEIPGYEISEKISRLERVVEHIFNRVEEQPALAEELQRFMKYYLPTTVKLLKAYAELDKESMAGVNVQKSKREIEESLDTINTAFENLLDGFYRDAAFDIKSDISVMNTMLKQEGLLEKEK